MENIRINGLTPSQLDDPVVMQTDWTPLKDGGANFRTHNLVKVSSNRLKFRSTIGDKCFSLIFLLIGLVAMKLFYSFMSYPFNIFIMILVGLIPIMGGVMLYNSFIPIVFDRQTGFFSKKGKTPLENIHALQIISEYVEGSDGKSTLSDSGGIKIDSYHSYELNLVLEDGKRINVVEHNEQNTVREDAAALSEFLEKPVWDAT